MFQLLSYFVSAGANAANTDMVASTDTDFSQRNSHYIFSENYDVLGWAHLAVSATRARFNIPTINAIGRHQVWAVMRSATPTSPPRFADYRNYKIRLPVSEEIAIEASNNLACGNEDTTTFLWIAPPAWSQSLPRGEQRLVVRATAALARTADSWATGGAITFAETLKGGWYCVNGAYCFDANLRAFRLNFVRGNIVNGRKLRPGSLATAAIGNEEAKDWNDRLGVWGYFHSFEPPTLEVYADAAGASTQELRLDVTYMGDRAYGPAP